MLIDEPKVLEMDVISKMIANMNGNITSVIRHQKGVYERGDFGSSDFLKEYEQYPDLNIGSYGICDNIKNLLDTCLDLENSDRKFVITLTKIERDKEPSFGGWRYHKWGDYIGNQEPENEYIYDDKHIDVVYCYSIYEKI